MVLARSLRFSLREAGGGVTPDRTTASHSLKICAMAVRGELNDFGVISRNDKSRERSACCRTENCSIFFPSYRYGHSVTFPSRPKPRRALPSYTRRLQYELFDRQFLAKIHDPPGESVQFLPKYESTTRETALEKENLESSSVKSSKSFSAKCSKSSWLSKIKEARKGFSNFLMSHCAEAITSVIIGSILVGLIVCI